MDFPSKSILADMAEYQKNTIIRKSLIDKAPGTATPFAFNSGQGLSEHTAPFNAIVLILEPLTFGWNHSILARGRQSSCPQDSLTP